MLPVTRDIFLLPYMQDGTKDTILGTFTIVRDFRDVCFHSYFSVMDDLLLRRPPDVKYLEIRFSVSLLSTSASCFIHIATHKTIK